MNEALSISLQDQFRQIGFSRNEAKCLIVLINNEKILVQEVSQQAGLTFNMCKVMLEGLVKRELIKQTQTDVYEFLGMEKLNLYLDTQESLMSDKYAQTRQSLKTLYNNRPGGDLASTEFFERS